MCQKGSGVWRNWGSWRLGSWPNRLPSEKCAPFSLASPDPAGQMASAATSCGVTGPARRRFCHVSNEDTRTSCSLGEAVSKCMERAAQGSSARSSWATWPLFCACRRRSNVGLRRMAHCFPTWLIPVSVFWYGIHLEPCMPLTVPFLLLWSPTSEQGAGPKWGSSLPTAWLHQGLKALVFPLTWYWHNN